MILVDTSIWIDHLRRSDPDLVSLLESGQVLAHPWIIGELALGRLANRTDILRLLDQLPRAVVAADAEIRSFIEARELPGSGIGYVDAQLVASTLLTPESLLWTRDLKLARIADRLAIARR